MIQYLAQFQFNWTLTVGQVVMVITLMGGILTWWNTGNRRLYLLEDWQKRRDKWEERQTERMEQMSKLLDEVSRRMERLDERHRLEDLGDSRSARFGE